MVDETHSPVAQDNVRTLMYYLGLAIDERLSQLRKGTPYEKARPSDARVFVRALRHPQTISEIARELQITRQAAQKSVQRLLKLQVLKLQNIDGNKRDKLVVVTPRGVLASRTAGHQVSLVEQEFAALIGKDKVEEFRRTLVILLDGMQSKLKPRV